MVWQIFLWQKPQMGSQTATVITKPTLSLNQSELHRWKWHCMYQENSSLCITKALLFYRLLSHWTRSLYLHHETNASIYYWRWTSSARIIGIGSHGGLKPVSQICLLDLNASLSWLIKYSELKQPKVSNVCCN